MFRKATQLRSLTKDKGSVTHVVRANVYSWFSNFVKVFLYEIFKMPRHTVIRPVQTGLLIFTEFVYLFVSFFLSLFLCFSAPTHNGFSYLTAEPLDLEPRNLAQRWT